MATICLLVCAGWCSTAWAADGINTGLDEDSETRTLVGAARSWFGQRSWLGRKVQEHHQKVAAKELAGYLAKRSPIREIFGRECLESPSARVVLGLAVAAIVWGKDDRVRDEISSLFRRNPDVLPYLYRELERRHRVTKDASGRADSLTLLRRVGDLQLEARRRQMRKRGVSGGGRRTAPRHVGLRCLEGGKS